MKKKHDANDLLESSDNQSTGTFEMSPLKSLEIVIWSKEWMNEWIFALRVLLCSPEIALKYAWNQRILLNKLKLLY